MTQRCQSHDTGVSEPTGRELWGKGVRGGGGLAALDGDAAALGTGKMLEYDVPSILRNERACALWPLDYYHGSARKIVIPTNCLDILFRRKPVEIHMDEQGWCGTFQAALCPVVLFRERQLANYAECRRSDSPGSAQSGGKSLREGSFARTQIPFEANYICRAQEGR